MKYRNMLRLVSFALIISMFAVALSGGCNDKKKKKKPAGISGVVPADGAQDQAIDAQLDWDNSARATSYYVYFGTTAPATYDSTVTLSEFDPGALVNDRSYYWSIIASNTDGNSAMASGSFRTVASSGATIIEGVAAIGAGIANAAVILKDANGVELSGMTDSNGDYSFELTPGMVGPYILQIASNGGYLYSYCPEANPSGNTTVTIHPFTDLIVRAYYAAAGTTDVDALFATLDNSTDVPSSEEIDIIEEIVNDSLEIWMIQEGIDPTGFDLFSTGFNANGSGFDGILDYSTVTVNASNGTATVVIDDGDNATGSLISTLTMDDNSGTLTSITTVTSAGGNESSFSSEATIVYTTDLSTVLDGAEIMFGAFVATINTAGGSLCSTDLLQYYHDLYYDGGRDKPWAAASMADEMAGAVLTGYSVDALLDYDEVTMVALVAGSFSDNLNTMTVEMWFAFDNVSSTWKFYGDQLPFVIMIECGMQSLYSGGNATHDEFLNLWVRDFNMTITGVTVEGSEYPGVFDFTNSLYIDPSYDEYGANIMLTGGLPSSLTELTIVISTASGNTTFMKYVGANSAEPITITSPAGQTLAAANIGGTLTVTWANPTSYVLERAWAKVHLYNIGNGANQTLDVPIAETTTSATFAIPNQLDDGTTLHAIERVTLDVSIRGTNDEQAKCSYVLE